MVGSKGQNSFFSEHGHVAYQSKGNDKCSNMQAYILSLNAPLTLKWDQSSKHFFLKVVTLHIKLIILCTISLAISYVSHLFCAHLCAVRINFNCNDENRILGK